MFQQQKSDFSYLFPSPYSRKLINGLVQCLCCSHCCILQDDQKGRCGVKVRTKDTLYSLVYGQVVAENIDPIEKKPLYHVLPGSSSYSIATMGCNFRCKHCQNASISQVTSNTKVTTVSNPIEPSEIVDKAFARGCSSISYTYVEPTVYLEFAYDCCLLAKEKGLRNIFISNGYMTRDVIKLLAPVTTAINIDLKAFSESFYKDICGAHLEPVLKSIAEFKERGVWVEVTTLLIPTLNDSDEELRKIASFLVGVDRSIVWHVTGFYPSHQLTHLPPTSVESLIRAREIGLNQGLHHVYTGNRPGHGGENTFCRTCGGECITREGFQVGSNNLKEGVCPYCNTKMAGVWG